MSKCSFFRSHARGVCPPFTWIMVGGFPPVRKKQEGGYAPYPPLPKMSGGLL